MFKKNGNLFLERSIGGAVGFLKEAVFSEDLARSKGLLQSVDPRIKMVALLASVVITCFVRNVPALAVLYAVSVILAYLSGIGVIFFIKRVWFFIPIFALLIAIPAVFTQGLIPASVFVLRVATCVSFAVLMTVTTKHKHLFGALRSLGVPAVFVNVLDMTYRYIFLFIKVFEEMHLSLRARLVKSLRIGISHNWIASRISFLFRRSMKMSEEVYLAMLARGYTGESKKYGK